MLAILYLCFGILRIQRERKDIVPGKTPANPSAFSIKSSTGKAPIVSYLFWPSKADEGYMLVPIPRRRPVSFPIAS